MDRHARQSTSPPPEYSRHAPRRDVLSRDCRSVEHQRQAGSTRRRTASFQGIVMNQAVIEDRVLPSTHVARKEIVSEVKRQWDQGATPDARAFLDAHPEIAENK